MIFSKTCEYGIKASIYIAKQSLIGKRSNLKDISKQIASPEAFTAKILQKLVKAGIIHSTKGATGGFEIEAKKVNKIKLIQIVHAIDEEFDNLTCALGLEVCSERNPCPIHHRYKQIKSDLKNMLLTTSLLDMSNEVSEGFSRLKSN